jgi:protein kinase C substrate 80K-H
VPVDVSSTHYNTTLALPGFYCKNKGHQPSYLPFTYVNDGICDYELCCDGSDEWQNVGGTKCEDKCKEIGKEWRKHNDARQKSLSSANRKRKELISEASKLRKQVEDRLQTLQTEIEGSELKVTGLRKELSDIERRERGKVVKGPKAPGKLGMLAQLAKDRITELRESLGRVRSEREMLRGQVKDLEDILRSFKDEYNPNFNDEGVKRAVKRWEDYAAQGRTSESDSALERDLEEMLKSDEENGLNWADYEGSPEESDVDVCKFITSKSKFPWYG